MKKGDIVIVLSVLTVALVIFVIFIFGVTEGKTVKISRDNEVIHTVNITEDTVFDLETNIIKIENGSVFVESATCKNQVCVNHKPISKRGEVIACLPNKVIIEIE